jgi:hypothetical protein
VPSSSGNVPVGAAAENLRISGNSIEARHRIRLDLSDPRTLSHKNKQALHHGKACSALETSLARKQKCKRPPTTRSILQTLAVSPRSGSKQCLARSAP